SGALRSIRGTESGCTHIAPGDDGFETHLRVPAARCAASGERRAVAPISPQAMTGLRHTSAFPRRDFARVVCESCALKNEGVGNAGRRCTRSLVRDENKHTS